MTDHRDAILDQFTRQAVPFATASGIKDEAALKLVVDFSGALGNDDLGVGARRVADQIHFGYPVAVLAARRS
ncbi:MAG: hypothetical protein HYU41_26170 [Candidatus Rokubacteria bacterium]|nr:hypothetical protein [Candidatus Rokubacteria bacterium]